MASLRFLSFETHEPQRLQLAANSSHVFSPPSFTPFTNHTKGSSTSCLTSYFNYVKASRIELGLPDASIQDNLEDAIAESSESKSVGNTPIPRKSKFFTDQEAGPGKTWKRTRVVRESVEDHANNWDDEIEAELDISIYGIGPHSSLERCNMVLKRLESCNDSEAMKFFMWMRGNGKLRGNLTAHNLVLRVLGRRGDWEAAEKLIEGMKLESGCELDSRLFNTIIYSCYKRGLVDIGTKWFRLMLEYDIQPNIATCGMVTSLYQKGWNVEEAEFAFSIMRKLNLKCQSAYSAMITIYTRFGLHDKAEEIIGFLAQDEVTLNLENWLVVLNSYSQQGKLEQAESTMVAMQEAGFSPNIVAYNTLITGYGRVSDMDNAERLFQSLQSVGLRPDETSYRSMIEGWARAGDYLKVKWYYEGLKVSGFKPNSSNLFTLINLQAREGDEEAAARTVDHMVKMGCQCSSVLGTVLKAYERAGKLDKVCRVVRGSLYDHVLGNQTASSMLVMAYVKHGLVEDGIRILREKQWKDGVFEDNLYHLLICSCKESGHLENAVEIYTRMPKSDEKPNLHITSTMIDIYGALGRFSDAEVLYQTLKSSGTAMDLVAFSVVVRMYVKAGSLDDACAVLDDMEKQKNINPDIYLLRDMLRLYQRCGKLDKLADLYYRLLKSEEVTWDEEMYNCVINCCARALPVDELSRIFDEMIDRGLTPNTVTCNVLIDVYGKSRLLKKARRVFSIARKQGLVDVISYNTLVSAYGQSRELEEMASTVQRMEFNGFSVSLEAYNCMLDAYGKEREMEKFRSVLQRMKESSCASDCYTYNIMINIYGENGWIEEVGGVLRELKEVGAGPDLCSYNTLIKAYGIAGMVEEAVSLVKEMRGNGIDPDRITYVNLITALRRNDEVLEAVKWSLWMKQVGFS